MPFVLIALLTVVPALADNAPPTPLDRGYRLLYNLDFAGAQEEFTRWQQQNPGNPFGPVSEAAGILFAEFNRLGVLEAEFLTKDEEFTFKKQQPRASDPAVKVRFEGLLQRAETQARSRLKNDEKDLSALFAMPMTFGLRADHAALIEKRNLAALDHMKHSTKWAQRLLAVQPDCYDAYLACGTSKYTIGSLFAPVRWLFALSGYHGDKQKGVAELKLTAERGRYLAPFARILLAIIYVREQDKPRARQLLVELQRDFPKNPLFGREIERLDGKGR